jgi:Transcriptional regulators
MESAVYLEEATTLLDVTLRFMRVLWALDHSLQTSSKHMETKLGVTGPQRLAVRIVGKLPGISPVDLAAILHIHPNTLTGILRRLEKRRAVRRVADSTDGRKSHLVLTSRGNEIDKLNSGTVEAAIRHVLSDLPPKHINIAEHVISNVIQKLDVLTTSRPESLPTASWSRWQKLGGKPVRVSGDSATRRRRR